MRKFLLISLFTIFTLTSLISCKIENPENSSSSENEISNESTNTSSNNIEQSQKFYYPFTGIESSEDPNSKIPYMAVVENSKASRPQSGLSFADIVYETSAEGGIPRFIALYHSKTSEKIGPIRSIRPYFLTLSKEYSLPIAHCGGSKEALTKVESDESLMSLNEMKNGKYYFRDASRKAPHNLYTTSEKILNAIKDKQYDLSIKSYLKFDSTYFEKDNLKTSSNITIKANNIYETKYVFENGTYTKYMDGKIAIDSITNKPLTFTNIIVQKTDITLQTDNSHLDIDLISDGEGYLFSNGKVSEILWSKDSETSSTILFDTEGNEISLSPGNTIWNIIDSDSSVSY